MATHTCSSMPIFSKSKQVMPQMVAMRQSHPPNTCIGRLLALSSTIFEIGPDMSRSTSGRNRHSISMCPLAVAKSTDAMQLPQGILGRSIRVKILRVSASQQLCPHLFIRTRWRVKFLCPWQCYTSHFSHLMLRPTLQIT